jgi:hypothetical protein
MPPNSYDNKVMQRGGVKQFGDARFELAKRGMRNLWLMEDWCSRGGLLFGSLLPGTQGMPVHRSMLEISTLIYVTARPRLTPRQIHCHL